MGLYFAKFAKLKPFTKLFYHAVVPMQAETWEKSQPHRNRARI